MVLINFLFHMPITKQDRQKSLKSIVFKIIFRELFNFYITIKLKINIYNFTMFYLFQSLVLELFR